MRNLLASFVVAAACAACASSSATKPAAAPPPAAAQVIQSHSVAGLVAPSGGPEKVRALAADLRARCAPDDADVQIVPHGEAIVVVAAPDVQRRILEYLLRLRGS